MNSLPLGRLFLFDSLFLLMYTFFVLFKSHRLLEALQKTKNNKIDKFLAFTINAIVVLKNLTGSPKGDHTL